MSLPSFPAEIHELIIAEIATWGTNECQKDLSNCALVCAAWHSFTLRHTFRSIELLDEYDRDDNDWAVTPTNTIAQLMESNPDIPSCVKSIYIPFSKSGYVLSLNEDDFERVCRLCTTVSDLWIREAGSNIDSHPRIRNGLLLLLGSPSLRHLTFYSTFRTSLLEAVQLQGLKSLTFKHVRHVVKDHEESTADLSRSKLHMVKLWYSDAVINTIYHSPAFFHLLGCTRHVQLFIDRRSGWTLPLWDSSMDWSSCTSVDLSFECLLRESFPWVFHRTV